VTITVLDLFPIGVRPSSALLRTGRASRSMAVNVGER
jgi:hypothetical protein